MPVMQPSHHGEPFSYELGIAALRSEASRIAIELSAAKEKTEGEMIDHAALFSGKNAAARLLSKIPICIHLYEAHDAPPRGVVMPDPARFTCAKNTRKRDRRDLETAHG
jgi:hypothetical protein